MNVPLRGGGGDGRDEEFRVKVSHETHYRHIFGQK